MPINPNIALGVQPQQPVNYLAQMGQAMALKAASQDIQGNEALRNFYASGGNAGTPEGARALMAANPKMGMQILKNTAETQRINADALSKSFANAREGLGMVRTPEDLLKYSISQFSDPLIGPSLKAKGLTPETVAANLQKELSTSGFDAVLKKSAMGLDGWYKDQTSRRNQDVSSGASYQQAALAREKFQFEKDNPGFELKTLDNGSIAAVNKRTNEVTLLQTPSAAPASTAGATPPVNALAPTAAAPAANLNALVNPPVANQPGAPTIANANAPTPLRAAPRPGYQYNAQGQQVPIMDPTKVVSTVTDKNGTVRMLNAAGEVIKTAVGMGKPSAGVEKAAEKDVTTAEGKQTVDTVLNTLFSQYDNLVKEGGITDTRKGVQANIAARSGATEAGQYVSGFTGSKAQEFRDTIEQTRPLLLNAIKTATGMSAQQLNSNVELQTYLKTATDSKLSIQANVNAMNNISKLFGLGKEFKVPDISTPKTTKATDAPPPGLSPEIAGLWQYMTPEDRKLWQK